MLEHWLVQLVFAALFACFRFLWNIKERTLNPDARTGARLYDIAFRHNLDTICMPTSLSYFCLSFKRVVPLSAILEANVYLYCYDSEQVAFIVVEPGKEIWRSKYNAFYKTAQFEHAEQIIRIPFDDFVTVCQSLPNLGSKLNFVHYVSRSGSTLLIQMFEATGKCISVSEPDDFIPDPTKLKAGITHKEKAQLFKTIGNYVARGIISSNDYNWYFVKVYSVCTIQFYDVFKEIFPESKHILLHRDFEATLKSTLRSYSQFPYMQVLERVVNYAPGAAHIIRSKHLANFNYSGHMSSGMVEKLKSLWYKHRPHSGLILYGYCAPYRFFLNQNNLPAIRYDDLVENRQENARRILEYFNLPLDLVDRALEAMEHDSQRNTVIARNKIASKGSGKLDEDTKRLAEDFCKLFNIPGFCEDQRHRNTITVPALKSV